MQLKSVAAQVWSVSPRRATCIHFLYCSVPTAVATRAWLAGRNEGPLALPLWTSPSSCPPLFPIPILGLHMRLSLSLTWQQCSCLQRNDLRLYQLGRRSKPSQICLRTMLLWVPVTKLGSGWRQSSCFRSASWWMLHCLMMFACLHVWRCLKVFGVREVCCRTFASKILKRTWLAFAQL